MSLAIYLGGLLGSIVTAVAVLRRFGRRPHWPDFVLAIIAALLFTLVLGAFSMILAREGNSSRILLLMLIWSFLLFAFARPITLAVGVTIGLWFLYAFLASQHLDLATSIWYTDNPRH